VPKALEINVTKEELGAEGKIVQDQIPQEVKEETSNTSRVIDSWPTSAYTLDVGRKKMNPKATKILTSHSWGSNSWKSDSDSTQTEDQKSFAKWHVAMFDPPHWTHDEVIEFALRHLQYVDTISISNAFVASLETRELSYRSAFGSFSTLRHIQAHEFEGKGIHCRYCGEYANSEQKPINLNVLNFERTKWGGVRHLHPVYAGFDLSLFRELPPIAPSPKAIEILKKILEVIDEAPEEATSAQLEKIIGKTLKSNKSEREVLIAILGFSGVLEIEDHKGFLNQFIRADRRELPFRRFVDMPYPSCWWTGKSRINPEAVNFWFGHLLK